MSGRGGISLIAVIVLAVSAGTGGVANAFFGELDPGFGGGSGRVITDLGGSDQLLDVARQSDGKLVGVGRTDSDPGPGLNNDFLVVRYNTDGSFDPGFGGGDGIVTTPFGAGNADDIGEGVAIQPDGKVVAVGEADMGATGDDMAVARYNT